MISEYEELSFPQGRILTVDGVQYKAYTLSEYKQIAHVLLSYEAAWEDVDSLEQENVSFGKEVELWKVRYNAWKKQCESEKKRGNIYFNLWKDEKKARISAERRKKLSVWLPWTIAALEAIALASVGISQAVR